MKYYLSAITGFAIWGTFALVLKPLQTFSSLDILLHRVIYASILILIACFLFRKKESIKSIKMIQALPKRDKKRLIINIVLSALMLTLNWYSFIFVMNAVSVNATSLAYLICPILTTFLASIFLKEKLNKAQWFAVCLSLISCLVLAYGHFMDLFYSILIALTYAIYLILQKNSYPIDKFFSLTLHIVVSTLFLLPSLFFTDITSGKTLVFHELIFVIAVLYTIIPLFLNIFALKNLDSSVVGTLLYINPILSFIIAIVIYKEPINTTQIIVFSLIFISVVIFNWAYLHSKKIKN